RRTAARARAFQERRVEPAAVLVRSLQIHHGVGAAVDLANDVAELREVLAILQNESMRRSGIEPDVEDVVDLLPVLARARTEKALAGAVAVPGIGAFVHEGLADALIDRFVLQDIGGAVALLADEHGDWHAPGALARNHPV